MKIQFCVEFIKSSLKMLSALKSRHLGIPASVDLGRFPFPFVMFWPQAGHRPLALME